MQNKLLQNKPLWISRLRPTSSRIPSKYLEQRSKRVETAILREKIDSSHQEAHTRQHGSEEPR